MKGYEDILLKTVNASKEQKSPLPLQNDAGQLSGHKDNNNTRNKNVGLSVSDLDRFLTEARLSPTEEVKAAPVCLQIIESEKPIDVCTLGNFSLAIGKAKSRKTFLTTLLFSVVTGHKTDKFSGGLPADKKVGIYFDTEQSRYHVLNLLHRICKLTGKNEPKDIIVYSLRKYTPQERLQLIEHAIYNTPNLGFVVIDGMRDLVTAINDEEQATLIAGNLLKWTEELNIHIMAVLHQNKNDDNARGHLGTELVNKAESVISITKDPKDKNISIVEPDYCRDKDFEPFAFTINIEGLPEIVEQATQQTQPNEKKNIIHELGDNNIRSLLKVSFLNAKKLKYSELRIQIKLAASTTLKKNIGDNNIKIVITYSKNKNWLLQEKDKAPYTLGELT